MSTHSAVATVGIKAPLALIQVPTIQPTGEQIRLRVEWTASTPLDLHQNDGGLLVKHPQVLGDTTAGTVVEVGPDVKNLKVGDKVFGFTWRNQAEKAQQEYCTAEEWLFAKLPEGITMSEAVTLPDNFVTVFHTLITDLGIETPWPKPKEYVPENVDTPILIWGGSSSVGQFAIQILRYYGYTSILATASRKHHVKLQDLGAQEVFDYNDSEVVSTIIKAGGEAGIPLVFDCIGSKFGSIAPISQIVQSGAKVAILLPIIVRDSSETQDPEYAMDIKAAANWQDGVDARGVRTHFYLDNEFFKYHLQPEIMYSMLKDGIVKPQKQKIVEGATLLERAQKAMDMLRRKEASMERLVWRVCDA
ncbi:GroES-like protein [Cucurbitaria berberidis CBS 394.84]|uniref:GroES-like protein n=1 Tax=Cucurbitaria berberidis CBS 394.84 TaxID=1168544 RepID=A0A9P4G909_9PLEO|nr:GroES-like protein [Cucurbitaria berberidis CBS 394.84]KAF1841245.1 GroES-like protein [Cucurbitaria berberidis CBS 394.84]